MTQLQQIMFSEGMDYIMNLPAGEIVLPRLQKTGDRSSIW